MCIRDSNRSDWYSALRGFTPTAYVDGLQVPNTLNLASWRVDPYLIDSITVLRGPTSVLYGQDVYKRQRHGQHHIL